MDKVEGLLKTIDVFEKSILGGRADLILLNVRSKDRMRKICVFRDGMHFPGLLFK
jgi:hypothetical protein